MLPDDGPENAFAVRGAGRRGDGIAGRGQVLGEYGGAACCIPIFGNSSSDFECCSGVCDGGVCSGVIQP